MTSLSPIHERMELSTPMPWVCNSTWFDYYIGTHHLWLSRRHGQSLNEPPRATLTTQMTRHLIRLSIGTILLASCMGCTQIAIRRNIEDALNSLRLLRVAEESYRVKLGHNRYGTLKELYNAGLIDAELRSGTKAGYRFELAPSETSFKLTVIPIRYGTTCDWSFYLDESGVIRGQTSKRGANVHDPRIGKQWHSHANLTRMLLSVLS